MLKLKGLFFTFKCLQPEKCLGNLKKDCFFKLLSCSVPILHLKVSHNSKSYKFIVKRSRTRVFLLPIKVAVLSSGICRILKVGVGSVLAAALFQEAWPYKQEL